MNVVRHRRMPVIIESAYKESEEYSLEDNLHFARAVCREAVMRDLNPFASHLFYPQFLDDADDEERSLGIMLGLHLMIDAQLVWICLRPGESMSAGVLGSHSVHKKVGRDVKIMRFHPDGQLIGEENG